MQARGKKRPSIRALLRMFVKLIYRTSHTDRYKRRCLKNRYSLSNRNKNTSARNSAARWRHRALHAAFAAATAGLPSNSAEATTIRSTEWCWRSSTNTIRTLKRKMPPFPNTISNMEKASASSASTARGRLTLRISFAASPMPKNHVWW